MRKCYKCAAPYIDPEGPGFQEVCASCGSYVHCCMNCRFYEEHAHNHCNEPQAEYVSDTHGMNHCEYFQFRALRGGALAEDPEDPEAKRMRRRPDWRNVRDKDERPARGAGRGRGRARDPFGNSGGGGGDRAQRAREALDKLFKKPEE